MIRILDVSIFFPNSATAAMRLPAAGSSDSHTKEPRTAKSKTGAAAMRPMKRNSQIFLSAHLCLVR